MGTLYMNSEMFWHTYCTLWRFFFPSYDFLHFDIKLKTSELSQSAWRFIVNKKFHKSNMFYVLDFWHKEISQAILIIA